MRNDPNTLAETRRLNLRLLRSRYRRKVDLADAAGLRPQQLSQLTTLREGTNQRRIGDQLARSIERRLNLAVGWLDIQRDAVGDVIDDAALAEGLRVRSYAPRNGTGTEKMPAAPVSIDRSILVARGLSIETLVNARVDGGGVVGRGNAIAPGDVVICDTAFGGEMEEGKPYAIEYHDGSVRAWVVQWLFDGSVRLWTGDADGPEERIPAAALHSLEVIGEIVGAHITLRL